MPRFAKPRTHRRARTHAGQTLVATLAVVGMLGVLSVTGLKLASGSTTSERLESRTNLALEVGEAAVQRYMSRLIDDPSYYDHYVDAAEDPRVRTPGNQVTNPGQPWTGGVWRYEGAPTTWVDVQDDTLSVQDDAHGKVEYSLRVTAPGAGDDAVTVTATARIGGDRPNPIIRSVEARMRQDSLADYQMISDKSVSYGSTADTNGKIYSNESVSHSGDATGKVFAQDQMTGGPFPPGSADSDTTPAFSDFFPTPIDFNRFTIDLASMRDAAIDEGTYFNDPSAPGWVLQAMADGTVRVWKILSVSGTGLGAGISSLACKQVFTIPTSGSFFFEQSVVIGDNTGTTDTCVPAGSGARANVVDGRYTVGTNANIYIGGNINYETDGDDVLGLIARGEIIIARFAPNNLSWRAATLAQTGKWRTYDTADISDSYPHSQMTFVGSMATKEGGYASMYNNRSYLWDATLKFLRPPFFPRIEGGWDVGSWRTIPTPG